MHSYPEDLGEGSVSFIKILILRKRIPELPCGLPLNCSQYTPFIFHLIHSVAGLCGWWWCGAYNSPFYSFDNVKQLF